MSAARDIDAVWNRHSDAPAHLSVVEDDVPTTDDNETSGVIDDRLDPEAQLLCSLMMTGHDARGDVRHVLDWLAATDFYNPVYAHLFTLIVQEADRGRPFDPVSLNSRVVADGETPNVSATVARTVLVALTTLNAIPSQAIYYADQVLATWYRRQFATMTTELAQLARDAHEADLFPQLVEHGRHQRTAARRRETFLSSLPKEPTDAHDDAGDND